MKTDRGFVARWEDACRHTGLSKTQKTKASLFRAAAEVESLPTITGGRDLGAGAWEYDLTPMLGGTLDEVDAAGEKICAALGLHRLAVTRESPAHGKLLVNTRDPFPAMVGWRPPRDNGGHWASYGLTAAGQQFGYRVGRAPHLMAAGTTNSGKSKLLIAGMASAACLDGVEFWGIDPKELDLPLMGSRFSELIIGDDPDEIRDFLGRVTAAMRDRQRFLAAEGVANLGEWCDANGVEFCEPFPWVELIMDEFQDILSIPKANTKDADEESCMQMCWVIARKARALGIRLTVATQNPLAKVFPTEVRGQFSARWVGKTQGPKETEVAIGNPDAAKRCPAHQIGEETGEAYFVGASTRVDTGEWWHSSTPLSVKAAFLANDQARRVCAASMVQKPEPTLPGCAVIASRVPPVPTDAPDAPGGLPDGGTMRTTRLAPCKVNWRKVDAGDHPFPTAAGKVLEHRMAAFLLFDPPTCMDCGTIGTWHPDSIRVATVDGTSDVSKGNLATLCQTCMGRARGAVDR